MSKPIPKGRIIDGNIAKEMDSRFLNWKFFVGQGTIGLTVDRMEHHDKFVYENGNVDENAKFCYFKETDKPLRMCDTNINSIIFLSGTCIAKEWTGKKFGFKAIKGTWFGEERYAVRIDHGWREKK